jgi:succinate dehydrogenase subunit D
MKKSTEPFWWALFSAGGVIAALFLPVHIFLNGLVIPLAGIEAPHYEAFLALVRHPLTRLYLFGLISLSLFHWAHRFRFTLYDGLQLKHLDQLIAVLCYGSAVFGTLVTGYMLLFRL